MSTTNTSLLRKPFKLIAVPLSKFSDEAIPHHSLLLEQHKSAVRKFMSIKNTELLSREIRDKKRVVRQLKDLLYELDTLRAQVEDADLDKFDNNTMSLRKTITSMIKEYAALQKSAAQYLESQNEINENIENENPFLGVAQIQLAQSMSDMKLYNEEERLQTVEALNEDIEGVRGIFQELHTMVHDQKEAVVIAETNVENTEGNVREGLADIIKAYKLKNTAYPVTGALLGSLVGGPLGLVAGFKAGGLAALGCGLVGYTGGKLFKKHNDKSVEEEDGVDNVENVGDDASAGASEKKDI